MKCQCHLLADSVSGRIVLYGDATSNSSDESDSHNISLQFNNISQWLCYEDFLALEWNVRSIDTVAYFDAYPYEERIHLSTPLSSLSFSFRPHELIELRKLLSKAVSRLHWIEMLRKAQN
ncbi:hypothetical protein IC229_00570 [Spirosoma sp. BT702]|uniref:Uncharacterized protein n=1 Tax=Spirosoma profusum TaxID=2771354 RepID=A0A926XSS5_9BACT|nr:DUF6686 family protein [Spirosoma profusum]MBD2699112.1 hypothetical protein [Spirosoma profusum]